MEDPWKFGATWPREGYIEQVTERARSKRWAAPGAARVTHRTYGSVVVPMTSKLTAILNAAEVWGCNWADITDAQVIWPESGEQPVSMPTG